MKYKELQRNSLNKEQMANNGIANYTFGENVKKFFSTAAIGRESEKVKRKVQQTKKEDWKEAVRNVKEEFASLVYGSPDLWEKVSVFHNTTAAVQRIFYRLNQEQGTHNRLLLTTDMEYSGIISSVVESWRGDIAIVRIAHLVHSQKDRTPRDRIKVEKQVLDTLKRAFLLTGAGVIYISHVDRICGFILPFAFLDYVKKMDPRAVIIVDGAQAIGNIFVGQNDLINVDFYITSSHKWLCGKTSLGFICSDPIWNAEDHAQGYSGSSGSSGIGLMEALISACSAMCDFNRKNPYLSKVEKHVVIERMKEIEKHNIALASMFYAGLRKSGLKPVCPKPSNGIVAFGASNKLTVDAIALKDEDLDLTCIQYEEFPHNKSNISYHLGRRYYVSIDDLDAVREPFKEFDLRDFFPLPCEPVWRACFHYYHDKRDVKNLLVILKQLTK